MKVSSKNKRGSINSKDKSTITSNAEAVLAARYLKKDKNGVPVETATDLFKRVADVVSAVEKQYKMSEAAVETIREEFFNLMSKGVFLPNSPTLMNAGRSMGMLSACFVLPVEDSIDGIFSSIKNTAMIQKAGGGTGFSFSRLRPKGDHVNSSGGTTSGPLSFMKVFSEATNAIQQGAFRRGANMGMMRIDHPDILDFISVKENLDTLTNFNLSVSITNEFMDNLKLDPSQAHIVYNPRSSEKDVLRKEDGSNWSVGEVYDKIVHKAWDNGEPGVVFIDHMNAANPTPQVGEIEATNPCGEQPLLPYESCNLGSINVSKFVEGQDDSRSFNFELYRKTINLAVRFLDDVIDANKYPLNEIEAMTKSNRKIGLGVMGFADALFGLGISYDDQQAFDFGGKIMQILEEESHKSSELLAEERGCFPNWEGSTWHTNEIKMRNAATTCIAPTGTLSIIADCSGGIEPLFSLAYERNVLDGKKLVETNPVFKSALHDRQLDSKDILEKVAHSGSLKDIDDIPAELKRVFKTSRDISPADHVRMQAAFQDHCDASISKTINFDNGATEAEVKEIFMQAYDLKCKGLTVYRDGCRKNQPMSLKQKKKAEKKHDKKHGHIDYKPEFARPMKMPDIMSGICLKQMTPFGNMHVKVVVDPVSQRELEVFAQLGKGGDVACSDLEGMCRLMSLYLRINGSLKDVIKQLDGIGSSLAISTKDGRITSLADGLAKALKKYSKAKKVNGLHSLLMGTSDLSELNQGLRNVGEKVRSTVANDSFKLKCPECISDLIIAEGCAKCVGCGYSQCS